MTEIFLLFPVNLFKKEELPDNKEMIYYLVEEPVYFGMRDIKMNFVQQKLVLHRASMKYYKDYLSDKKIDHEYINFDKVSDDYDFLKKKSRDLKKIHIFDPTDHFLLRKLEKIAKKFNAELEIHENPNFLTPVADLEKFAKNRKKFFHATFYEWQKKRMNILKGRKSYDKENREGPPKSGLKIPDLPPNKDLKSKYVKEAIAYVRKNFPKNYGNAEDFLYPITHETSEAWFKHFLKNRFDKFGKYQDAIVQGEPFMFHSVITPMLNIGLLQPSWIIEECQKAYKSKQIKINNYEGYVRQVIGWREYSRMLYLYAYSEMKNGNYFNHRRELTEKWYHGTTGVKPIDDTIKSAFKTGYLHHILRLMMMCNFFNLCGVKPDEVYKWFMEFSCDSYDWLMTNNVYSMGLFVDGGLTMRKPYLSTDNYILKMSDYKKDGYWDDCWHTLYYYFLYQQHDKLEKTAMVRNLHLWDKKSKKEQDEIKSKAKKYLREIF